MAVHPLLRQVLNDEALTRGLRDPEARVLVEWLVEWAEHLADSPLPETVARVQLDRLCRKGRAISRFVVLWCHHQSRGAASQLAAAERFTWPLPTVPMDPCELMQRIVWAETREAAA